jgi:hypothetical protein
MAKQPELWISMDDLRRHSPEAAVDPGDVLTDAFGRTWVLNAVAKRVIERVKEDQQAELDARQAYARYVDDRTQRRNEVVEKIRAGETRPSTPASAAAVHQRIQAALTEFDEREGPELGYYDDWRGRRPKMQAAR